MILNTLSSRTCDLTKQECCTPCKALYPLILTQFKTEKVKGFLEKWIIQQGLGNINKPEQTWVGKKKKVPRHGIAAPVRAPQEGNKGELFCFLPLSIESGLPVHVNGSFFLTPDRKALWNSCRMDKTDTNSKWNIQLYEAIESSYADFINNAKEIYMDKKYGKWKAALIDLNNYCSIFPQVPSHKDASSHKVIKILLEQCSDVLCVLKSTSHKNSIEITVHWYPIISQNESEKVYFAGSTDKLVLSILMHFGMNITYTWNNLRNAFNSVIRDDLVPIVSQKEVFEYYIHHSPYSSDKGMKPCLLSKTTFGNMKTFLFFINYLTDSPQNEFKKCCTNDSSEETKGSSNNIRMFPDSPFSHFLLMSADGILRKFDSKLKIFNSNSRLLQLFSNHKDKFLHPQLHDLKLNPDYFISPYDYENPESEVVDLIVEVLAGALPDKMLNDKVIENAPAVISKHKLKEYWECISEDSVLRSYIPLFLKHVALLPTLDKRLFSSSSKLLPVYPYSDEDKDMPDILKVLSKVKFPFLDLSIVKIPLPCPNLSDYSEILGNIVHLNESACLTGLLNDNDIDELISYLGSNLKISESLESIKCLPFFEDVANKYVSIADKQCYVYPSQCTARYQSWISDQTVVFVKPNGSWTKLGSATQLSIMIIEEEDLYCKFIFPRFQLLNESERYQHLKHVRDHFQTTINTALDSTSTECQQNVKIKAQNFYECLAKLKCISSGNSELVTVSCFGDHTKEIFHFSVNYQILPCKFHSEEWLSFFKKIGLRQSLSKEEYLHCCNQTAESSDYNDNSTYLLEYLFSDEVRHIWYDDQCFLNKVSTIQFIKRVDASKVDWVLPTPKTFNRVVKLRGSAAAHLEATVWTCLPLIELPKSCYISDGNITNEASQKLIISLPILRIFPNASFQILNISRILEE